MANKKTHIRVKRNLIALKQKRTLRIIIKKPVADTHGEDQFDFF